MLAHSVTVSQSCFGVKSLTLPMIGIGRGPGGSGTTGRERLRIQAQSKRKTARMPAEVEVVGRSVKSIEGELKNQSDGRVEDEAWHRQ